MIEGGNASAALPLHPEPTKFSIGERQPLTASNLARRNVEETHGDGWSGGGGKGEANERRNHHESDL